MRWSKTPSALDIAAFTGLHCARIYRDAVLRRWRCPCCDRTPHELIRWSEIKGPHWRARYADARGMGWTTAYARHHCHAPRPRFVTTLICGDCNSADGAVKRGHGLPADFSFSPCEIRQFVTGTPHQGVTINHERALAIYRGITGT
jgi:hypothetical protein